MAEPLWLKGRLAGLCVGKPAPKRGGSGLARWYRLELVEAIISEWAPVPGPPSLEPGGVAPFCQAEVKDARLRSRTPGRADEVLSLREVTVWDWKVSDQREGGGASRCTLTGTVYAQAVDGTRRPFLPDEDRLGRRGCLALLLGLLLAFWLWWTCGPLTSVLWASVVLTSWWGHRMRTRRRSPPSRGAKALQGLLALAALLTGALVVLGISDSSGVTAGACGETGGLAVLLAMVVVVAASLLTVSWPLPWAWLLWSLVVILWCGRLGMDCAGRWVERRIGMMKDGPARGGSPLERGLQGLSEALGVPLSLGSSGDVAEVRRGRGPSQGSAKPRMGPAQEGPEGEEGQSPRKRESDGGGASGGGASGGGASGGGASGGGASGGGESGGGGSLGAALSPELEASSEPRMSVDAALSDPRDFLQGNARVTLSGDLLFAFDEDVLRPESESKLRQVARLLRVDPRVRVLLEGHADTTGGEQYNQRLSERRAQAVKAWLVERAHIDSLQIDTVGYGDTKPIVSPSKGPAAQHANRRVEVRASGISR